MKLLDLAKPVDTDPVSLNQDDSASRLGWHTGPRCLALIPGIRLGLDRVTATQLFIELTLPSGIAGASTKGPSFGAENT